ncbi:MAG: glycosyltransferase family 39 protein [Patescibacteria group bacterium]
MTDENKKIITSFIVSILIVFSAFFVFYDLGKQSLHPWDEAWYASISRNIIESKNIFDLKFNTFAYWDHPPLGFYFESLAFLIFGINDFSARFSQATLGIVTIVLIFLTGKKIKNNWVGFSSALILLSSRWFLFRARTGNLDILLTCSQILVFYFVLNPKFKRHLYLLWAAFAFSLLSKSLISFTLAPLLIYPSWQLLQEKKINKHDIYRSAALFVLILSPWYLVNTGQYGAKFLKRNLFEIGFREGSSNGVGLKTINKTLNYLHAACHKWFKLFLISTVGLSILTFFTKNKNNLQLLGYLLLTSFPYFISSKTEIWHLIPILAPLSLIISVFLFTLIEFFSSKFLPKIILITGIIIMSSYFLHSYWFEFIKNSNGVSDIAILAPQLLTDRNVFISNEEYYTSFIFYADLDRPILLINKYDYQKTCQENFGDFYLIAMEGDWFDKLNVKKQLIAKQANFKIYHFQDQLCEKNL